MLTSDGVCRLQHGALGLTEEYCVHVCVCLCICVHTRVCLRVQGYTYVHLRVYTPRLLG